MGAGKGNDGLPDGFEAVQNAKHGDEHLRVSLLFYVHGVCCLWLIFPSDGTGLLKSHFGVKRLKIGQNPRFLGFMARREGFIGQNESVNARREAGDARRAIDHAHRATANGRREGDDARRASDTARGDARPTENGSADVRRGVAGVQNGSGNGRRETGGLRRAGGSTEDRAMRRYRQSEISSPQNIHRIIMPLITVPRMALKRFAFLTHATMLTISATGGVRSIASPPRTVSGDPQPGCNSQIAARTAGATNDKHSPTRPEFNRLGTFSPLSSFSSNIYGDSSLTSTG